MADQSVTNYAGFFMTFTFTEYRGIAVGVAPEFVISNTGTDTVISVSKQIQAPDQPIYGGYYKLQIGTEFIKILKGTTWTENIDWNA